jgi:hypothetical protein
MKRLFHIGVIALLMLGNWGTALAAFSCARAQGHACCMRKSAAHEATAAPAHDAMMMDGMMDDMAVSSDVVAVSPEVDVAALDQAQGICAHCMAHSGAQGAAAAVPHVPARSSRELSATAPRTLKTLAALASSFAPRLFSRERAAPLSSTSRHVLISLFLI